MSSLRHFSLSCGKCDFLRGCPRHGALKSSSSSHRSILCHSRTHVFRKCRYLYSDDVCLEADNVLATLYAAKKYLVPNLARACVEYLETSLTARNACVLLSQSRLFEEPDLMQRCWEVIDAQAELALSSDGFVEIDFRTLESILSRETLNAKEVRPFVPRTLIRC